MLGNLSDPVSPSRANSKLVSRGMKELVVLVWYSFRLNSEKLRENMLEALNLVKKLE